MKKSTVLKWGFVVVAIFIAIFVINSRKDSEVYTKEEQDFDNPSEIVEESIPPVKVNVVTKEEDVPEEEQEVKEEIELDKTVPHFNLEMGEASFSIYSNNLTKIPEDASGDSFYYQFQNGSEMMAYLLEKKDAISLDEMESNYADVNFCRENNLNVFKKEKLDDGILYLLSYDGSLTPDVIEVWKENDKAIFNIYYVDYERGIDEDMVDSIKKFLNHIEDTTAKG